MRHSSLALLFLIAFGFQLGSWPAIVSADPEPVSASAYEEHEEHHASGGDLIGWFGRLHPIVVHFPIALLSAALLGEALYLFTGAGRFASAGRYCLVLGAVSAIVAATLGWFWEGFHLIDGGGWRSLETLHRWSGTLTALGSLALLVLCPMSAKPQAVFARRLYRLLLIVTVALLGLAGYYGGSLVWGVDHLAW